MTSQGENDLVDAALLDERAAEQRARIHESVGDLKSSIADLKTSVQENIRERLDLKRLVRQHLWKAAAGAAAFALFLGYGIAGMFTRR